MKRHRKAIPLLAILLLCVACAKSVPNPTPQTPLQKAAEGLVVFAKGVGTLQTAVIQGNQSGAIPDATTRTFMDWCIQANSVGQQASSVVRQASTLSGSTAQTLLTLLGPISASLNKLLDQGVGNIKNPATLNNVKAGILALQSTISAIQVVIAGGA